LELVLNERTDKLVLTPKYATAHEVSREHFYSGTFSHRDKDRVLTSWSPRRTPLRMFLTPLVTLLNPINHSLTGLDIVVPGEPTGEIYIEQPDSDALKVWMFVDPEPIGPLQALVRLIKRVQPLSGRDHVVPPTAHSVHHQPSGALIHTPLQFVGINPEERHFVAEIPIVQE
jgi:hypothetical protein